jgi:hypothetical protein
MPYYKTKHHEIKQDDQKKILTPVFDDLASRFKKDAAEANTFNTKRAASKKLAAVELLVMILDKITPAEYATLMDRIKADNIQQKELF